MKIYIVETDEWVPDRIGGYTEHRIDSVWRTRKYAQKRIDTIAKASGKDSDGVAAEITEMTLRGSVVKTKITK